MGGYGKTQSAPGCGLAGAVYNLNPSSRCQSPNIEGYQQVRDGRCGRCAMGGYGKTQSAPGCGMAGAAYNLNPSSRCQCPNIEGYQQVRGIWQARCGRVYRKTERALGRGMGKHIANLFRPHIRSAYILPVYL